jgi:hypothetical protein
MCAAASVANPADVEGKIIQTQTGIKMGRRGKLLFYQKGDEGGLKSLP